MGGAALKKIKHLKKVKYILAVAWVGAIVYFAISAGGYKKVDLLYNTESGISVDNPQAWITYFTVVAVVLIPAFLLGKRGFCHYLCPWGVLNIVGTRIKNYFKLPSLTLKAEGNKCKRCKTCDSNCPMSLEVSEAVQSGSMYNTECIMCDTCVDVCPQGVIRYSWKPDGTST